eukprot:8422782-Lingulodinium_polyedra.AAC.1
MLLPAKPSGSTPASPQHVARATPARRLWQENTTRNNVHRGRNRRSGSTAADFELAVLIAC